MSDTTIENEVESQIASAAPPRLQERWTAVSPYALIVLMMYPSFWWITHDHTPFSWDQSLYARQCVDLWYTCTHTPFLWPQAMLSPFNGVPPATIWLEQFFVPLGQQLGSLELGLLLGILCIHFCTLVLIYRVGQELCPDKRLLPLAGVLFLASAPLAVGLSHHLLNESLQLLAVTYCYLVALRSAKANFAGGLVELLLAVCLAFMSKASSVLYCGFPLALAAVSVARSYVTSPAEAISSIKRQPTQSLLAATALGVTAGWYICHIKAVYNYVTYASYAAPAILHFGSKDVFSKKLDVWIGVVKNGFFFPEVFAPIALLVGIAGSVWLTKVVSRKASVDLSQRSLVTAAAALHTVLVLCVCSTVISEDTRYLFALLPSVVILVIRSTAYFRAGALNILICSLAAGQFLWSQAQTLTIVPVDSRIPKYLTAPCEDQTRLQELQRLGRLTGEKKTLRQMNMCGVEFPWLNNNTIAMAAAKEYPDSSKRCQYGSFGTPETDAERFWPNLMNVDFTYFITADEPSQNAELIAHYGSKLPNPPVWDFPNQLSVPILHKIRTDQHFVAVPFESKLGIKVWQRVSDKALSPSAANPLIARSDPKLKNITFGNRFIVRGIVTNYSQNALVIEIVWQSAQSQKLDFINAVHVINTSGNIAHQQDYYQSSNPDLQVSKGDLWHDTIIVPADKLKDATAIGVCVYKTNQERLRADHGPTDWDQYRLLIPIKPPVH